MTKAGISPGLFLRVGLIVDVCLGCRREEPGAGHAFLFRSPVDEPEYTGREGHIHAHWLFRLGVDGDELVQGAFRDVDFKFAAVRFGLGLGRSQTGRYGKGRAAIRLDLEPAGGRVLCRFEGFLQRVAEGVAAFQIREEYAERAVFLRQKLCDVVVSHTHLEYMGLAGAFAPSRGLTKFQAALLLDALEGGERDFLFRVGNRGLSGLRGVPEVPVASGRPGDNLNPTILFQPLDDLFARHPVPPSFRCVLNTHLGRICQAFDVYFVCI